MKFTNFFSKKIKKNPNFDFLNKFAFDKEKFREIEVSYEYFFPSIVQKFPILPLSHDKRIEIKDVCNKIPLEEIM